MAEDLDNLMGSFFDEINHMEFPKESSSADEISTALCEPTISEVQASVIVSRPEVISKPAEIKLKASHPVYTYDFGTGAVQLADDHGPSSSTSSSSSLDGDNSQYYSRYSSSTITSVSSSSSSQHQYSSSSTYGASSYPGGLTGPSSSAPQHAAPPVPLPSAPRQDKKFVRTGAGEVWVDDTLNEWPANDFRIFVGDLAKEVTTEILAKHFQSYKSFVKAKVIRGKDSKTRGYGFVSFLDPMDCAKAIRQENGKYLLSRPMKISKSAWQERNIAEVKKKESKKRKLQESLGLA